MAFSTTAIRCGTDVSVNIASSASRQRATPVHFSGSGRLRNSAFTIEGNAESLLALEDRHQPYRLDVKARAGDTQAQYDGTVIPARLDSVDGMLMLQGRDLSQLYPIIPVPFPWTPPYRLSGRLKHDNALWSFHQFTGKVGDSDLAGRFDVDRSGQRLLVDADLVSQSLNYKDLGGLIGLPPAAETPSVKSAAQKKETAKRAQTGRALPTKPYDPNHLRAIDAKVHLKGKRFMASDLPLDNLNAVLDLHDGILTLQPLDFGVAGGHVVSTLVMDAREKLFRTKGEMTARNVELGKILPKLKPPQGSAGKVGGQAHFVATGNSIADMLATSNGEAALISWGGQASELSIVLTNLDLARAAQLLLKGERIRDPLRRRGLRRRGRPQSRQDAGHRHRRGKNPGRRQHRFCEGALRPDAQCPVEAPEPSGPARTDRRRRQLQLATDPSRGRPDHGTRGELGRLGCAESAGGADRHRGGTDAVLPRTDAGAKESVAASATPAGRSVRLPSKR
jgi:uncharacterized protein involved in outer membrane biogenesis